jgi:hypothetical protein
MIQALPLVESGADLSTEQLALASASHNGAAIHREWVSAWLDALGLGEGDLRCGPQEPADLDERDRLILAQLRFLGIERGQPFAPDERQTGLLEEGALVGEAMAKANTTDKRVEPPFWEGTHWKHALVVSVDQKALTYDQLDERAAWFYEAVVVSKAMLTETPGVGQRYIASYKDAFGDWLSGENTYRLHVPANPPAAGFWSVTAYDEATRQMPVTEQGRPDISSRKEDIAVNEDGSIDVYFGPEAPEGHEANWVQINPDKGWFAYFRFYGPTEPFFDKSWALPDIERVE